MPPVTILSPYSGRPVKVREQDLGRAVRDEEGRVFYVVEDPEHGRYAARTRKGSDKDLQRYREMQAKIGKLDNDPATQASRSATVYDATGTKRRNPVGLLLLLVIAMLLAGAAYLYITNPGLLGLGGDDSGDAPADTDEGAPTSARPGDGRALQTYSVSFGTPQRTTDQPAYNTQARLSHQTSRSTPLGATLNEPMPIDASPDPRPVIVPTRTWRPERVPEKVVFVSGEPSKAYRAYRHTASGLRYKITHHTDGPTAQAGNFVTVRYTAQTLDGEPLIDDASQSFVLMSGQAIRAFDEGLAGIREGEQMRMMVPRGHSESGRLPGIERVPDQPFLLDVQLVSVRPGVTYIVEEPGTVERDTAGPGDSVAVHYVARVEGQAEVFDATSPRGEPMVFTLGAREVIPGLELGLTGMRPGETRLLTIPPYLAYGDRPVAGGLIPADAVLSFRVMLVSIDKP